MKRWRVLSLVFALVVATTIGVGLASPAAADRFVAKSVAQTAQCPGKAIDYEVKISIPSLQRNVVLEDLFLYGIDYVPGSAKLDGKSISDPVNTYRQLNRIVYEFRLGDMDTKAGGQPYLLTYQGKIPLTQSCYQSVANETHLRFDGAYAGNDRKDTKVLCQCVDDPCPAKFTLTKTAGVSSASPGSIIPYKVEFDLVGAGTVHIEDLFLYGVDYVAGSCTLDGKKIADPVEAIHQLKRIVYDWDFPSLSCGHHVLAFNGRVDPNYKSPTGQKVRNEVHFYLNGLWKANVTTDTPLRP